MLDDLGGGYAWASLTDKTSYLQNVYFYIGDDPNIATENQLCEGSPFLNINDPNNYFDDPISSNGSNLKPWKYG